MPAVVVSQFPLGHPSGPGLVLSIGKLASGQADYYLEVVTQTLAAHFHDQL